MRKNKDEIEKSNRIVEPVLIELENRHRNEKKFKEWEGLDEYSTELLHIMRKQVALDIMNRFSNTKVEYDPSEEKGVEKFRAVMKGTVLKIVDDYDLRGERTHKFVSK